MVGRASDVTALSAACPGSCDRDKMAASSDVFPVRLTSFLEVKTIPAPECSSGGLTAAAD